MCTYCPGVSFHLKPDYSLEWGAVRLGGVEEEPPLQRQFESEVPVSLTEMTVQCLDQPTVEVHEDLNVVIRQSLCY